MPCSPEKAAYGAEYTFLPSLHTAQGISEILTDKILQYPVLRRQLFLFHIIDDDFSSGGKSDHIPVRKTDEIHKPFRVK